MKEMLPQTRLTENVVSPTLNTVRSSLRGNILMPEPTEPAAAKSAAPVEAPKAGGRVTAEQRLINSLSEKLGESPAGIQQAREILQAMARAAVEDPAMRQEVNDIWTKWEKDSGRPLTAHEIQLRDIGIPPISGGSDTPQGPGGSDGGGAEPPPDEPEIPRGAEPPGGGRDGGGREGGGPRGGDGGRNNDAGDGPFRDLIQQALLARTSGALANPLLETLMQQAVKRAGKLQNEIVRRSGQRDASLTREERLLADQEELDGLQAVTNEYRFAESQIRSVYNEINPGRKAALEQAAKQAAADFIDMIRQTARNTAGGRINTEISSQITEYIKSIKLGGDEHLGIAGWLAQNESEVLEVMSEKTRQVLYEQLWEKFVGRADDYPEGSHYRESLSTLTIQNAMEDLSTNAEEAWGTDSHFVKYLRELAHARSNMHDLNSSFKVGDEYKKAVVQQLNAEGLHFVQNELAGVNDVILMYEKFSAAKVAETHSWLSHGDVKNIDKGVKETMYLMSEQGLLKQGDRVLTRWEIDRALRLGKITFAGTQRMAMYAAFGNLPPDAQGRTGSIPYEYVARAIYNFKMQAVRFFNEPAQVAYMDKIFNRMIHKGNGEDNGKFLELFGADQRMVAANSLGAFDIQSHSWRSQLIFLNNISLQTGENGNQTFVEYMNDAIRRHQNPDADLFVDGLRAVPKNQERAFENEVKDTVLAQRLYLTVLARSNNITESLRNDLWKKMAILKPSTIVSLLPNDMISDPADKAMWNRIQQKLFIAEAKRVQEDTHEWASIDHGGHVNIVSRDLMNEEMQHFTDALGNRNDDYKYQILRHGNFSDTEQVFIKRMIDLGIQQSGKLSKADFSQTLVIDDAPFTAWTKTGAGETGRGGMASEDIVRILFSDQGAVAEGWNPINLHVFNPTIPPRDAFKAWFEKCASVYSATTAQGKIEAFVLGYMDFCRAYTSHLWLSEIDEARDKPGSPIAEFFRQSHIAMDEKGRRDFLIGLANDNVISDNVKLAGGGPTQLRRLEDESDSNRFDMFLRLIRIFLQYGTIGLANNVTRIFHESIKKI